MYVHNIVLRNANVGTYTVTTSTVGINIQTEASTGVSASQTILLSSITGGALASGETALMVFDSIGIQFQLSNLSGASLNASFASAPVSGDIAVDNDWNTATFQLGSSTRDTFSTSGFKDVRITGYNNNSSVATSTGIKEDDVFKDITST